MVFFSQNHEDQYQQNVSRLKYNVVMALTVKLLTGILLFLTSVFNNMMVGPVYVVLIIHRQLQGDKNRSDLKLLNDA